MADFEVDAAEKADKPKAKPRPAKKPSAGGGGAVTAFAFVVAIAAVGMCIFLFMQLQKMNALLEGKKNLKAQGTPEAVAGGQPDQAASSEYSWQDEPWTRRYDLGEFKTNTSDGKYASMKIWLMITSGPSETERANYDLQQKIYQQALKDYQKNLTDYMKKNKLSWDPSTLPTGAIPAAEGEGAAATGPPVPPPVPEEPKTVMEVQLDDRLAEIRDAILTLINSHAAADLITPAGKDAFKKEIIDRLNSMIERYYGTIDDVLFEDFLTT